LYCIDNYRSNTRRYIFINGKLLNSIKNNRFIQKWVYIFSRHHGRPLGEEGKTGHLPPPGKIILFIFVHWSRVKHLCGLRFGKIFILRPREFYLYVIESRTRRLHNTTAIIIIVAINYYVMDWNPDLVDYFDSDFTMKVWINQIKTNSLNT